MQRILSIRTFLGSKTKKSILCFIIIIFICLLFGACKNSGAEVKKIKDLEFTVVEESDVPEELMTIINEKKKQPFKLSYTNADYLYIAVGYGVQNTGGYSISVDDFFLTKNAIYIDTTLIGPSKSEPVTQALTYPYIVIKTEAMDKGVVFN